MIFTLLIELSNILVNNFILRPLFAKHDIQVMEVQKNRDPWCLGVCKNQMCFCSYVKLLGDKIWKINGFVGIPISDNKVQCEQELHTLHTKVFYKETTPLLTLWPCSLMFFTITIQQHQGTMDTVTVSIQRSCSLNV